MNKLESRFLQNRMLAFYTLLVRVYAGLYEEAIWQALKTKNTYALGFSNSSYIYSIDFLLYVK